MGEPNGSMAMLQRLVAATNAHDIDAVVDCFADDYRSETPAHPARGFEGRGQVRTNWQQIFRAVPDIAVEVLEACDDAETVWTEWRMAGTRADGSPHRMAGVIIFTVRDGRASSARFYLEGVEEGGADVNQAVRQQVSPGVPASKGNPS